MSDKFNTAFVTGAARGIGRAIALTLARQGFDIAFSYISSEDKALTLKKEIEDLGVGCMAVRADMSKPQEAERTVEAIRESLGGICVLINNAGIAQQKMLCDITNEDWDIMLSTNLSSVFYCCRAVTGDMIRRKKGKIINISSMWGLVGASCETHYSAAKAGVIGFTKALAKELGPSGIQVNAIAPGVIDTDMNKALPEAVIKELREETPLGRTGSVWDIANAAAFLASDKSDFITGQIISINGGFVIV